MIIQDGEAVFAIRKFGGGELSRGMIVAYSGKVSNGHPLDENDIELADWHVCDGTNGTPDLRGRFILCVSDGHAMGSTGGEETHTLTVDEMPSHVHPLSKGGVPICVGTTISAATRETGFAEIKGGWWNDTNKATSIPLSTGGSQPHNNMPPYYALAYIMKL